MRSETPGTQPESAHTIDKFAVIEAARAWLAVDTSAETSGQLAELIDAVDRGSIAPASGHAGSAAPGHAGRADAEAAERAMVELADMFAGRLAFGTAGIRGKYGPGPMRLNTVVARQVAAGFGRYLTATYDGAHTRGVVVGRDGRHGSADCAAMVVETLLSMGFNVWLLDGPLPTPLAAFTLRAKEAVGAVVVTASHNPPADNGIKVYDADGAQIVPPADAAIAAHIDDVAAAERAGGSPITEQVPETFGGQVISCAEEMLPAFLDDVIRVSEPTDMDAPHRAAMAIATTAMHGVGDATLRTALTLAGFQNLHSVAAQRDPDPTFPTVAFPNPEEPGALDLLGRLAAEVGAAVAIANDPDADRCAAMVPSRSADGTYVRLTGDQLGALLASRVLADASPDDLLATTVVSSQLMGKMCAAANVHFAETLTGFKWLCRPSMSDPSLRQRFLYEEALGYALGDQRDKDGIAAGVAVADLVASLVAAGRTVWDALDDIWAAHGLHVTRQVSIRTAGPASEIVPDLDSADFGDLVVERVDHPAADVTRLFFDGGHRVALRPSGTEPKFKAYLEAVVPVSPVAKGGTVAAESTAITILDRLEAAVLALLATA